jgi:uncharacterized membrane protein YeaQ/YmgE (transglycosylase-associated protein family)
VSTINVPTGSAPPAPALAPFAARAATKPVGTAASPLLVACYNAFVQSWTRRRPLVLAAVAINLRGGIMGLVLWIIFGALAGWLASLIMGTNERQGCLLNIVVGVIGAFIGGLLMELLTGADIDFGFNLASLIVAVIGAIVLLAIVGLVRGRR